MNRYLFLLLIGWAGTHAAAQPPSPVEPLPVPAPMERGIPIPRFPAERTFGSERPALREPGRERAAGVEPLSSPVLVHPLPRSTVRDFNRMIARSWSVSISNGQASNFGTYPIGYLDARTLSFPAPPAR